MLCRKCVMDKHPTDYYKGRTECKECTKAESKRTRERKGKEAIRDYNKQYWRDNKESLKVQNKAYYEGNREVFKSKMREYYRQNKSAFLAYNSRRRAKLLQATPDWVDMDELKHIAEIAQSKGLVIDHIVPLIHSEVCGLHVPANLRCVPKELNAWKSNKLLEGVRNGV